MQTYFSVLVLAAVAQADVIEDIKDLDPQEVTDEVTDDFERALVEVREEIECWWAERTPQTSCAKWEREIQIDACYDDGLSWNWEENYCMTLAEGYAYGKSQCAIPWKDEDGKDQTGVWVKGDWEDNCEELGCGYCDYGFYELVMSRINGSQSEDEMRGNCEASSDVHWVNSLVVVNKDFSYCTSSPNKASSVWGDMSGDREATMVRLDSIKKADFQSLFRAYVQKPVSTMKQIRVMADSQRVKIDLDLTVLSEIEKENAKKDQAAAETLGEFGEALGGLFETWAPKLEQMAAEQQRRDEEIAMKIAELLADSVSIDGVSIRDMAGNPEDWYLYRKNMARKMVTRRSGSKIMREITTQANSATDNATGEPTDPTNVHVTIDIPTMEAIDNLMSKLEATSQQLESDFQDIFNNYGQYAQDALEDFVSELEPLAEVAIDTVNSVGDEVKTIIEEKTEVTFSLAQKGAQQQSADYSKTAAGVTFGVIALATVFALANRKKTVHANEEALL